MQRLVNELESLRSSGNFRSIPTIDSSKELIDFSTNDYMGLGEREDLYEQFIERMSERRLSMTASASRLLSGSQKEYSDLENLLSTLYDNRPVLLFNSGYHANVGLLSCLADRSTLVLADRLIHASMIDGLILSRSTVKRFRHNDLDELEKMLTNNASSFSRIIVAVEAVYSMDGDSCDLERLVKIKHKYPDLFLYVDEAHSFGVCGPRGLGLTFEKGLLNDVDIIIGTLGKAAASSGAFAVLSQHLREYAVNRARSLIFSTALAPINVAWSKFMIETLLNMDVERSHLRTISRHLYNGLKSISNDRFCVESHIQPLIIGDAAATVEISHKLLVDGVKILPIRTPTVPAGTERLRLSLSAARSLNEIDRLLNSLKFHLS